MIGFPPLLLKSESLFAMPHRWRTLHDPEFVVEGIHPREDQRAHPQVREIDGVLVFINYAHIFRVTRSDPFLAMREIEGDIARVFSYGVPRVEQVGGMIHRRTAGLSYLSEFVGAPIDPAACRVACLRRVQLLDGRGEFDNQYEALCEIGLDVRAWRTRP